MITIEDFKKLDVRIGRVIEAKDHPNAQRLLVLKVDIGGEIRQLVAGIKSSYAPESLVGKSIVVLCNLQPANLRGVESNGMLLAASHECKITLLVPEEALPPGSKVS